MRKSYSGAGRSHGTVRPRGQTPGAAATNLRSHRHKRWARDDETRGGAWRNGRWVRDVERRRHPRAEAKLRRVLVNPMGVAGTLTVPARSREQSGAGPVRRPERNRPRMTRAAASPKPRNGKAPETRGAKNRMGEPTSWRGCRGWEQRRSGMARSRLLRAVRRDRRTPKGSKRNLMRGACRSVRVQCDAGGTGGPVTRR